MLQKLDILDMTFMPHAKINSKQIMDLNVNVTIHLLGNSPRIKPSGPRMRGRILGLDIKSMITQKENMLHWNSAKFKCLFHQGPYTNGKADVRWGEKVCNLTKDLHPEYVKSFQNYIGNNPLRKWEACLGGSVC